MKYIIFAIVILSFCISGCYLERSMVKGVIQPNIVEKFNIDNSAKTDVTKHIQRAIQKEGQITLPRGLYLVNGTLRLMDSESIHLDNGARLIRNTFNEEPMVWLYGTYSSLTGNGKNSVIQSKVNSPNGIIRIGHANMQQSKKNVLHATVKDLRLEGLKYGGGNDDIIDKGIYMPNPQHRNMASYFNTLQNLLIANVDIGIHLQGFANANSIKNIVFVGVGNSPIDAAIWVDGAQENRISDVFHHHSTGVGATILFTDCINGPKEYTASFNRVESVISEPDAGRGVSRCLIFESKGSRNYFSLSENNINGNKINSTFIEANNMLNSAASGKFASKASVQNQFTFLPASDAPLNSLFVDKKDGKLKFNDSTGKKHDVVKYK